MAHPWAALLAVFGGLSLIGCERAEPSSDEQLLTCGTPTTFAFEDLAPDPDAHDAARDARLATFLASPDARASGLPATGWIRLADSPDTVLFGAPHPTQPTLLAFVELTAPNGRWVPSSWGECRLRTTGSEAGPSTWTLEAPPARSDTSVVALVSEVACSGGRRADGRLLPPIVRYDPRAITITFLVVPIGPLPGELLTCGAPPPTRVEVLLREPIGTRDLLDGGLVAPERVE